MKTHMFNDQHDIVRTRDIPVAVRDEEGIIILFPPAVAHDTCNGDAMMAMDCIDCVFDSHIVCTGCLSFHQELNVPANLHKEFIAWAISAMTHFDSLDHPWFEVDASNPLEDYE